MGKGGPSSTTSTVTQSNLPAYARPYYESLMQRGQTESQQPYEPYSGQRLAGISSQTQAGLNQAGSFARSGTPLYGESAAMNRGIASAAGSLTGYQPGRVTNTYSGPAQGVYDPSDYAAQQLGFGSNGLNEVGTGAFNQSAADQYMSPYMKAVVESSQADALQNAQEATAARNLAAARAGSFGGSRQAVANAIADRELSRQMSDISVRGQQSAFEQAMAQFNADQQRKLQADTQNQQTALSFGQGNQQSALEAARMNEQSRQYGYGAGEQAFQTAAQLGQEAQKATEQFRQSGAQLGLEGLQTAQQSAQNLQQLQAAQDQAMLDRIKAQLGIGQTMEEYEQESLDQAYQDFINQRDAERQNLQFLSSLLQGIPVSANRDVMSTTAGSQNNLQGLLGSIGGLQSLYQLGQQ